MKRTVSVLGVLLVAILVSVSGCRFFLEQQIPITSASGVLPGERTFDSTGVATQAQVGVTEYTATSFGNQFSQPRIGNDGTSDIVVYGSWLSDNSGSRWFGYQRFYNGSPYGNPVPLAGVEGAYSGNFDIHGDYIIFIAGEGPQSFSSQLMLYQISTGTYTPIGDKGNFRSVGIYGNYVIYDVGISWNSFQVYLYDMYTGTSTCVAGPFPYPSVVDIDSEYAVWWDKPNGVLLNIAAYELNTGRTLHLGESSAAEQMYPSTSGSWITWVEVDSGTFPSSYSLKAFNISTGEKRAIGDGYISVFQPYICGDFIGFSGRKPGSANVCVYQLSTGQTFQITNSGVNTLGVVFKSQSGPDSSNLIAYYSNRYPAPFEVRVANFCLMSVSPSLPTVGAGATQQFEIATDGAFPPATSAVWSVNDIPGGAPAVGMIDANGLYSAPVVSPVGNLVVVKASRQLYPAEQSNYLSVSTSVVLQPNGAPVSEAGADQSVTVVGSTIGLDGSQSYDPDGDPIQYSWSFSSLPFGSTATFSSATSATPTFVADKNGTYIVQLLVTDSLGAGSQPDFVAIAFVNAKPIADAGQSQSVTVGSTVTLDGSKSYDANGDPLSSQWSLAARPAGSICQIINPLNVSATFIPDLPGTYMVQLVVHDGLVNSDPSTIQILAVLAKTQLVAAVVQTQDDVRSINPSSFQNGNMKNALLNKLDAVIQSVEAGDYAAALDKLQNDILRKTDGCASAGAPDANDWVVNSDEQARLYPMILRLISMVRAMGQ
jgi:hypothetical protein